MLKMLDLFSGIGGFSLAADWTGGIETVAFCEIEPYCQKVLKKHWSDVPIYPDIKELKGERLGSVDIVCGGFPCQPFSVAGKRRAQDDDRHLWPEMFRIIQECKPAWVIGENVPGLIELALEDCFIDLEGAGYEVQPLIIPACGVNAPHRRDRVWILAHSRNNKRWNGERRSIGRNGNWSMEKTERSTEAIEITRPGEASRFVADTNGKGLQGNEKSGSDGEEWSESHDEQFVRCNRVSAEDVADTQYIRSVQSKPTARHRPELSKDRSLTQSKYNEFGCAANWDIEPDVGRVAYGIPNRTHRLRALGNSIVPQVVYPILQGIVDIERSRQDA